MLRRLVCREPLKEIVQLLLCEGVLKEQAGSIGQPHETSKSSRRGCCAGVCERFTLKVRGQEQSAEVSTGLADVQPEIHNLPGSI